MSDFPVLFSLLQHILRGVRLPLDQIGYTIGTEVAGPRPKVCGGNVYPGAIDSMIPSSVIAQRGLQSQRAATRPRLLAHHLSSSATSEYPVATTNNMSFPKTIKAIAIDRAGDIDDVLEVKELPFPTPAPGEVLIKASSSVHEHRAANMF